MTEEKKEGSQQNGEKVVLPTKGPNDMEKLVFDAFKRMLEENSSGSIKIEFSKRTEAPQDAVGRVEKAVSILCAKIDMLLDRVSSNPLVKVPTVTTQLPAPVVAPAVVAPSIPKLVDQTPVVPRKMMDYFIIDLTHVLNYIYNKNDGTTVDDMIETFVKAVVAEKPDLVIGYIYANPNFKNVAYETRSKICSKLEENKITIGVGGFHVYTPFGHKGYMQNGGRKFQDSDPFIIDITGEMLRTHGSRVHTYFIVSGDVDTMPALSRVKGSNIIIKVISFDDALSKDVENFVGRENCIPII